MEDQEDKEDGKAGQIFAESNNSESNEDHNTSHKNEQHPNEHLTNELNEEDKENDPIEPNDHDQNSDNSKEHSNYHQPSNHLETNSSLFTFENISSGPKRKLNLPKLTNQAKLNNNSYVSTSGFNNKYDDFKNAFEDTMITFTTESSLVNRSKFSSHEEQQEYYSQTDPLQEKNQFYKQQNSQSTTTASYLDYNSNEWSGSLSSSTVFTPIRAFKRKYSTSYNTTSPTPIYSTKRKQQTDDVLMFNGFKKIPHRTADETNNQLITTSNSAEQTSNQNIDRLAIEESENNLRNQTLSKRPVNDRTISELLSQKVNFNYHPILDFINRKD